MIVGCVLNMGNAPSYSNFNGLWQHSTVFNGTNHNPPQAHRLSISSRMMIPLILLWKPLAYYYYQWDHHPYGSYIIMVIYIFYRLSYSILLLFLSFYCFFKAFSVAFLKWPFFHDGNLGPAQVFFSLLRPRIEPRPGVNINVSKNGLGSSILLAKPMVQNLFPFQVEAVQLQRSEVKLNSKS